MIENEVVQQNPMVKCEQLHMKLIILEENLKREEILVRKEIDNINQNWHEIQLDNLKLKLNLNSW